MVKTVLVVTVSDQLLEPVIRERGFIEMIVGIGIDIIETDRVRKKTLRSTGFRERVFSRNEIAFCESKGVRKAGHYAARFSAKEAFLKATGKGLLLTTNLRDIEVCVDDNGKPEIRLHGELAGVYNSRDIRLSISHIRSAACAVVIIESREAAFQGQSV